MNSSEYNEWEKKREERSVSYSFLRTSNQNKLINTNARSVCTVEIASNRANKDIR